jgi:methylglyoxal/glyoxal reductase
VVAGVAGCVGRTPAEVLLRWCVQRGIPVITKSTHGERIAENTQVFGFELSDGDVAELDALDRSGGTRLAQERKWW